MLLVAAVVGTAAIGLGSDHYRAVVTSRLSLSSPVAGGDATQERPLLGDRGRMWRAASRELADAPLFGAGPGQLSLSWTGSDGLIYVGWYAHNEYLELAATEGLVGLAGLGAGLWLVARWARRQGRSDPVTWSVTGAVLAFGLHSGTDFLWRLPVLPITVALLTGLAWGGSQREVAAVGLPAQRPEQPCPLSPVAGPVSPQQQP